MTSSIQVESIYQKTWNTCLKEKHEHFKIIYVQNRDNIQSDQISVNQVWLLRPHYYAKRELPADHFEDSSQNQKLYMYLLQLN